MLPDYRWTNQTWSANQTRSYSATTFLDPDRRSPGGYKVAVRGYITGDPNGPFNFGIVGGGDVNYYKSFTAVSPSGRVNISSSGILISPSTVTIGQNFNISFSLQEYQGGSKTIEYVEIWIKDSSGNDLYRLDDYRWTNQTFSANQPRSYSAMTFLDPDRRPPGGYKVAVRGYITGDPNGPFNFGIVGGVDANYYKSFTAIDPPEGWISLSGGVDITPSNVILGVDFTTEFKLKETNGHAKTLENVVIAILDNSGTHLFDLHDFGKQSFSPYQEITFPYTGKLYDNRTPGIYKIEIRGRYNGEWFPLDTINGGNFSISGGSDLRLEKTLALIALLYILYSHGDYLRSNQTEYT